MAVFASTSFHAICILLLCLLPNFAYSTTQPQPIYDMVSLTQPNAHGYILQFYGEPDSHKCHKTASKFRKAANKLNLGWKERRVFHRLFNGMSINVDCMETLNTLKSLPFVKNCWPNEIRKKLQADIPPPSSTPQDKPNQPVSDDAYLDLGNSTEKGNLMDAHNVTGVSIMHSKYNLRGRGIKIGIIDTGIDYRHPYLGACWKTKGCPFQYGWDFVGDNYNVSDSSTVRPDPIPLDTCDGHGTHLAGIAAANGSLFTGVAPEATYGIYRVMGCATQSQTTDDIIIKALEMAYRDGMQIVNLSFGSPSAWTENPLSVAASRLVERGVILTASLGNSGLDGLYSTLTPAIGLGVTGVGSFEIPTISYLGVEISTSTSNYTMGVTPSLTSVTFVYNRTLPIVWSDPSKQGCSPLDPNNVAGKIVFALRGGCTFSDKSKNAQDAGAVGMLIGNTSEGSATSTGNESIYIQEGIISLNDTMIMARELDSGNVYLLKGRRVVNRPDTSNGRISFFSPYGPDPELNTYPSLASPGSQILSTYPLDLGGYRTLYGTSMASPYVASMMALMLQGNKWGLTPKQIQMLVKEHSELAINPNTGRPVSVLRQGSGKSNILRALDAQVLATPDSLMMNYTFARDTIKLNIILCNILANDSVTFELSHVAADSISAFYPNGTYTPSTFADPNPQASATVNFGRYKMGSIKSKGEVVVPIAISPPRSLPEDGRWFYSGYIVVKTVSSSTLNSHEIKIPYSGFLGDYRQYPIMDPSDPKFPILAYNDAEEVQEGQTYILDDENKIDVAVQLITPTRLLKIKLMHKENNTFAGYLSKGYSSYLGRNMHTDGVPVYTTAVNGTVFMDPDNPLLEKIQPGAYYVQIDALRPFGNINANSTITSSLENKINPGDYQSWISPSFIISTDNVTTPPAGFTDIPAFND